MSMSDPGNARDLSTQDSFWVIHCRPYKPNTNQTENHDVSIHRSHSSAAIPYYGRGSRRLAINVLGGGNEA